MSKWETRVQNARAHFNLLRDVHSLFSHSFPTVEDVEYGRYGPASEAGFTNTVELVNTVVILRSDIKCLPFKFQQIDIDQVKNDAEIDRLIEAFDSLLDLFEELVQNLEPVVNVTTPQVGFSSCKP